MAAPTIRNPGFSLAQSPHHVFEVVRAPWHQGLYRPVHWCDCSSISDHLLLHNHPPGVLVA